MNLDNPKTESEHQIKFIQWCKKNRKNDQRLNLLFAIPNGGARHIATASRMKLEGVEKGVPDLFLSVACHKKHGLYIEMKIKGNDLSDNQKRWKKMLIKQGYAFVVAYNWEEAIEWITKYLAP